MNTITKVLFVFTIIMTAFSCKGPEGDKASTAAAAEVKEVAGKTYEVDDAKSAIMWEGTKPAGKHTGSLKTTGGVIVVSDGEVTGGSFTLDMNSITVTDLEGDQKAYLESHLKGLAADGKNADDFFNVQKYPTGKFEITKVTAVTNDPAATHLVYGNLTLKETTKEVGFKAKIDVTGTGVKVKAPQFTIDRTQWSINYGSKSIFDNLKDKFINDEIGLSIQLATK